MAICLGESLVETRGFDAPDQLRRYVRWYREGHNSSTGHCFDIGGATAAALTRFEREPADPYPGDAAPDAAGNGPLMKLAPVPIAYAHRPDAAVLRAGESARTTHGAVQAVDATRYFAALLVAALTHTTREDLATVTLPDLHPEVAAIAAGSPREKHPPEIRGTGYVVDALEAALWAVFHNDTYAATVLAAANLGDDADTTAAIAGQLAGALYGVDAIPSAWRAMLHRHDDLVALADALHDLRPRDASPPVGLADLPAPDAPRADLQRFAAGFDGYAHFGDDWGSRHQAIMRAHRETGALPDDPDDVRAALFLAVRGLRFNGADTTTVETSPGHFTVQADPHYEDGAYFAYQRALVERLRELLTRD